MHAARRRLSAETIQNLLVEYPSWRAGHRAGKRCGISKGTVLRPLREYGISVRRQSMTEAEIEQASQLYQAGNPLAVVGAKLGYDHGTVHRASRQAGVSMRDCHGRAVI